MVHRASAEFLGALQFSDDQDQSSRLQKTVEQQVMVKRAADTGTY
jgi:hypothetical protein